MIFSILVHFTRGIWEKGHSSGRMPRAAAPRPQDASGRLDGGEVDHLHAGLGEGRDRKIVRVSV